MVAFQHSSVHSGRGVEALASLATVLHSLSARFWETLYLRSLPSQRVYLHGPSRSLPVAGSHQISLQSLCIRPS